MCIRDRGYCSRRAAEELIKKGRVKLNGHPASLGDKMDVRKDVLSVDDQRVRLEKNTKKVYFMLHKPRGYVTTMEDRHAAKTVVDLMEGIEERVYPVGRLDKDSEGLLLDVYKRQLYRDRTVCRVCCESVLSRVGPFVAHRVEP